MKRVQIDMEKYCLYAYEFILEFGGRVELNLKNKKDCCKFYEYLCELKEFELIKPYLNSTQRPSEIISARSRALNILYECLIDKILEIVEKEKE